MTPAYRQSQREPLPSRLIARFQDVTTNAREVNRGVPKPTDGTVKTATGRVLRYWTDGSLRRA
jgi:hypothetical protein